MERTNNTPILLSRRRFVAGLTVAVASVATWSLTGCVDQYPYRNEDGSVQLRLIATSPAVASICDKLNLDLVGVCSTSRDLPERYTEVEQVGTSMSPDLEIVKSLSPTYVLSPNSLISDLQPKYASIGVASVFLDLNSVSGLYGSVEYLGSKFDREAQATALIDEYKAYLAEYRASVSSQEAPKVLLLMGLPGSYVVATENSYSGSLVQMAGGVNVYEDTSEESFLNINTEDMLAKDPDIILRTAHAQPEDVMEMFAEEFATNDIWSHFRAVQNGRVYDLSYELFGMSATFDYAEALESLRPLLYPEEG